jgi:hypothetical protein
LASPLSRPHYRRSLLSRYLSSLVVEITLNFPTFLCQVIADSILLMLLLSIVISCLSIIILGPGYLPYNWSLTRRRHFTWQESIDRIVNYSEQEVFARANFSIDTSYVTLYAF